MQLLLAVIKLLLASEPVEICSKVKRKKWLLCWKGAFSNAIFCLFRSALSQFTRSLEDRVFRRLVHVFRDTSAVDKQSPTLLTLTPSSPHPADTANQLF